MKIFHIKNSNVTQIKEIGFKLEKDLQTITETNLETIYNLEFVKSEFSLKNLRIDTLAFDRETKSFVIIEYKKDKSGGIIDQGYAYLALMDNNRADFILEFNENMESNLKKGGVDWSQSKILFLANSFNTHQKQAINFKDRSMELWEVKKYDNGTILYNQLKPLDAAESITTVSKSDTIKDVSKDDVDDVKDDVLKKKWKKTYKIYNSLKEKILEFEPRLEENFTKTYIGFQINQRNVMEVYQLKEKINVFFIRTHPTDLKKTEEIEAKYRETSMFFHRTHPEDLKKTEEIEVKYRKTSMKHHNCHLSFINVNELSEIDFAMVVIKQVIDRFDKH